MTPTDKAIKYLEIKGQRLPHYFGGFYQERAIEIALQEQLKEITNKLTVLISQHRTIMYLTCREDCLCWDLEQFVTEFKQKHLKGDDKKFIY